MSDAPSVRFGAQALSLLVLLSSTWMAWGSEPAPALAAANACHGVSYPLSRTFASPYVRLQLRSPQRPHPLSEGFFLVDTGANTSAIDAQWAQGRTHAAAPGQCAADAVQNASYRVVPQLDFGYAQHDVCLHPMALSGLAPIAGEAQVGRLGTDFLSEFVVAFEPWQMHLYTQPQFQGCVQAQGLAQLASVPLQDYSATPASTGRANIPAIGIQVGGVNVPCQLDTGTAADGGQIDLSVNAALYMQLKQQLRYLSTATLQIGSADHAVPVQLYAPKSELRLSFGTFSTPIERIKVFGAEAGMPFADPAPQALMGMSVLGQLQRLILDPFAQTLYFQAAL